MGEVVAVDLPRRIADELRVLDHGFERLALVGDAAYAPSFLTGQGSSLALVGAYMLANALATNRDHTAAFAAYERDVREFVAMNQALVDNGAATDQEVEHVCPSGSGWRKSVAALPCVIACTSSSGRPSNTFVSTAWVSGQVESACG